MTRGTSTGAGAVRSSGGRGAGSRARRIAGTGLAAALLGVLLTGCLALDLTTSVSQQGTFTGDMTLTFDRQSAQEFGITDLSAAQAQLGAPDAVGEKVSVKWSETSTDYVQTITFADATPADIEAVTRTSETSAGSDGVLTSSAALAFPLKATPRGDRMVVSISDDAQKAGTDAPVDAGGDPKSTGKLARMLFGDSAVSISLTMPGDITEVTGVIPDAAGTTPGILVEQPDPRTFEMAAPFADLAVLEETAGRGPALVVTSRIDKTASAPTSSGPASAAPVPGSSASPPGTASEPAPDPAMPVPAAAAAGVVVLIGAGVFLLRRARSSAEPDAGSDGGAGQQDPPAQD